MKKFTFAIILFFMFQIAQGHNIAMAETQIQAENVIMNNGVSVQNTVSNVSYKLNSLVPKRNIFGGQLTKLKESLANPLEQITSIVFVGDSITWGRTLDENGVTDPRDGTLSDPRDNFNSQSFVNQVKRYIGNQYANSATPVLTNCSASYSGQSVAEYTTQNILYPKGGDFNLTTYGTSTSITEATTNASITGYQLRLSAYSSGTGKHEISFKFTGDEFTLAFASLVKNNLNYELFVDGISQGIFSTTPNGTDIFAGNNNQRTHKFPYVRDKEIKIVTVQNGEIGTNTLRIEGLIVNKKIRISNQGINGATSKSYQTRNLIGNTYGDGEAIEPQDNYVFVQLGTNDRITRSDTPKGTNAFKINLKTVLDTIAPSANVILMCANPVIDESTSTYSFTMQGVRNTVYQLAKENNIDMIDNYAIFNDMDLNTVLSDGLHPNQLGHEIIARNIINSIEY